MCGKFLAKPPVQNRQVSNTGAESVRRHENGLASPSQNALRSASTRKKSAFFPGTPARPRPAAEAPQRKGAASLALRRAFARPCTAPPFCGRPDARRVAPGKRLLPPFPKTGGGERSALASVQWTVPPHGRACLLKPLAPGRLKKVPDFCLAK